MPRYVKDGRAVETTSAREGTRLKAHGYTEQKARTKAVKQVDEAPKPTPPAITPAEG